MPTNSPGVRKRIDRKHGLDKLEFAKSEFRNIGFVFHFNDGNSRVHIGSSREFVTNYSWSEFSQHAMPVRTVPSGSAPAPPM